MPFILTPDELNGLRWRYAVTRQAAGLLSELGKADLATALYREAGDLLTVTYAVLVPCVRCKNPTPCAVSIENTAQVEAVLCGPCNVETTAEADEWASTLARRSRDSR
jgi:hypothetical protein